MLPVTNLDAQAVAIVTNSRLAAAVVCLALLAGCTATGPTVPADLGSLQTLAETEASAGDLTRAVELYAELVGASSGPRRVEYLITGAGLLIQSGNFGAARRWLTRAREDATPAQQQRLLVLLADVEVGEGRPQEALDTLALVDDPLPDDLLAALTATRGQALFGLGRTEDAIAVLVERELWLDDAEQVLANHRLLWAGLTAQTASVPHVGRGDPIIDGWLALAPVALAYRSDPFGLRQDLLGWRNAYPDHPAAGRFLAELLGEMSLAQTYPEQIALLLPLSSPLQAQARAIRDGFIAAHLRYADGPRARLKIYDTAILGTQEAYLRAQVEGADFIVGPLLKSEVEQIIGSAGFVPTLALNSVDTTTAFPAGFFQFALAPEDEAREVARYAVASGAWNAVALIPNSDWGLRLLASFQAELESLGGTLLQWRGYDPNSQDFSTSITTLLNISRSTQRYQRLAANLGMPIEFEPRRRQDVDMIFIAANAATGRLLAPQLRFHYAGDIPTYATSEIYEPGSRVSDSDLNGVLFPDTPWVLAPNDPSLELKASLQAYWPQRASRWIRLYGMGFDAYRLVPMLHNQPGRFTTVSAMSGELSLGADGKLSRRLPLAQFRNGTPVALGLGGQPLQQEPAEDSTELARLR